jgi:glycosyltransferase involved in cell wall biosynthesis
MKPEAPSLSVVLPMYNECENITRVIDEISDVLRAQRWSFEVVAVDDGSTDGTPKILKSLALTRPWLRVVLLRRNSGQSAALDAGLHSAEGDLIATMDSDGQNDPRDIPKLIDAMEREGADMVSGRRADRQDALFYRKIPSRIANFIIRRVTRTKLRDMGCSLKLYRKDLVNDLHLYGEMHRFIGVLVEGMGARSIEVDVNHRSRTAGKSKYGLERTGKVVLDLLTVWFMRGYQTKPIYIFGGIGLVLGALSAALAGFVLFEKLKYEIYVHRNPLFTLAVMLSIIGVQFLVLGLLAEILVRTYFESSERTSYHVRERINFGMPANSAASSPESRRPTFAEPKYAAGSDSAVGSDIASDRPTV